MKEHGNIRHVIRGILGYEEGQREREEEYPKVFPFSSFIRGELFRGLFCRATEYLPLWPCAGCRGCRHRQKRIP